MAGIEEIVDKADTIFTRATIVAIPGVPVSPNDDLVKWASARLITFVENHHLLAIVFVFFGVGGIVYLVINAFRLLLGFPKDIAGTRKDQEEATKTALENLQKLHDAQEKHGIQEDEHNLRLSILIESLNKNDSVDEITRLREEAIDHYCQKYLPTLDHFLDFYLVLKDRKSCVRFIKTTLMRQLEAATTFAEMVNHPNIIAQINRAPLPFTQDSFEGIWAFCDKTLRWYDFGIREAIKQSRKKWPERGR